MTDVEGTVPQDVRKESLAQAGQLICLLVYPDKKHVVYVYQLTNSIEEVLRDLNFSIKKISDDTPPDEHFGERFENLSKECSIAIVILDGFRPNVLFEYGYLRGINKIILPIKNKTATIAVKSLYQLSENAETQEIQSHTGLTKAQLNRLKEPPLDYFSQLSDRHGINLIEVDCNAELTSKNHPKTRLRTEIEKLMPKILDSYSKESLISANVTNSKYLKKSEKIMLQLLQYSTKTVAFESSDVKKVMKEIDSVELESGSIAPSKIYITASSLFKSLAKRTPVPTIDLINEYYGEAINLLKKPLNTEQDSQIRAEIQLNLGDAHVEFSEISNQEENLKEAIKAYNEALTIYTKEKYPTDNAKIQNNRGYAYSNLSDIRHQEKNLKEAIKAYNEALTIYTKEKYPTDYSLTKNNLGAAYLRRSEIGSNEDDIKEAIRIYREALTVRTKEEKPIQYAMTQNNIGAAYSDLLGIKGYKECFEEAIRAFNEALEIYTKEKYPNDYRATKNNLGNVYARFSCVEDREENLNKAIKIYREALTVHTKEEKPIQYAMTQNNIGMAYFGLSEVSNNEEYIKEAIKDFNEALTVYTAESYPIQFAKIQETLKRLAVLSVFASLLADLK